MINQWMNKFIRLLYDDLKVFLIFFLLMQIGTLYIDIRWSFLITLGFSSCSFFINGMIRKERYQRWLPFIGIALSFLLTITFYQLHTLTDQVALVIYHIIIWLIGARNLRQRIFTKRTMMYVFMPIIILTILLFGVYFSGVHLFTVLGKIYPFILLFYSVTFMLAIQMNLEQGYKSSGKTINAINKKRNQRLFSYVPNIILMLLFIVALTRNYEQVLPTVVSTQSNEITYSEEYVDSESEEDVPVEIKEQRTSGKMKVSEQQSRKSLSLDFESKFLLKIIVEGVGVLLGLFILYSLFKKVYNKVSRNDEEEEDLEIRESLLTKETIKNYFKNISNRFKRQPKVSLSPIREIYVKVVRSHIASGIDFEISHTASEYKEKIGTSEFNDLTDVYEAHRYGDRSCSDETLSQMKKMNSKNR